MPLDPQISRVTMAKESARAEQLPGSKAPRTPDQILSESFIDPLKEFTAPPICIEIMGKDGRRAIFGTMGNISVIKGRAKVSKTMLVSVIVASAMRNGSIGGTVFSKLPEKQRGVVWFDTEQVPWHVWNSVRRSTTLAGGDVKDAIQNFEAYGLRDCTPKERVDTIDYYLKTHPNTGLVIIDGVRDLLHDINDPTQSNEAVQHLMSWTKQHNVHVITVIHQNKSKLDQSARGHIGTELTNKAETVIEIMKDPDEKSRKNFRLVVPAECRNMEFDEFVFEIDEHGVPRIDEGYIPKPDTKPGRSALANEIAPEIHKRVLAVIFKNNSEFNKENFASAIRTAFSTIEITLSINTSRDYATYYELNNMVKFRPGNRGATIYSKIDPF